MKVSSWMPDEDGWNRMTFEEQLALPEPIPTSALDPRSVDARRLEAEESPEDAYAAWHARLEEQVEADEVLWQQLSRA